MSNLRLLVAICVFIGSSVAVPVGNSTKIQRRVHTVKFPPNSGSTSVRPPCGTWAKDRNTTRRLAPQEEPFVFPDEITTKPKTTTNPSLALRFKKSPPCAAGLTFCEDIDDYPGGIIENIIQNEVDNFQELLGIDELKSPTIAQRFDGKTENEETLCASAEQLVFPKVGKTKDDNWLFIVNQGSTVQGVRIEKCVNSPENHSRSCLFAEIFPIGYKAKCKQKYIYRKMFAVDEAGKPVAENFELPSCCSCSVINEGLKTRSGTARTSLSSSTTPKPK